MLASSRKQHRVFDIDDIEALVALQGLQLILHLGVSHLILKGDCSNISHLDNALLEQ